MANNYSAWQYSRWTYVIARSLRHDYPVAMGYEAFIIYLIAMYFGEPTMGSRPWLADKLRIKVEPLLAGGDPIGGYNVFYQPMQNVAKMLMVIAKDLKKTAITDAEAAAIDVLIAATGDRRYGVRGNTI